MKTFLNKLVGFSLGPVIGAAISFFTVPVTTYFINPTEFGKASMFTVIQSFILSIIYMGIDQSYTREYNIHNNKQKVFQNALFVPFVMSILLFISIFIFRSDVSILLFSNENYTYLAILFGLLIIFSVIERFILLSIRMSERALEYSLFSISLKLFVFLFTISMILFGSRTFLTIVYSNIFGQMIVDVLLMYRYRELLNFKNNIIDKKLLKSMLVFGLPLIVAASFSNLLNTASRFFLRAYSSFYELGIYTAALKIANVLSIVQAAFTSFWVPTAYRWHQEKKSIKHFSFVSNVLLLVLTLGFFFILFFKKYIVLILSSDYSEAQYVAGLLALTPILYTISETTTLGIVFSGKSYYNLVVSILALIPNILLNFLLVPRYGTIGAGIANASAYIVFCLARTYFSRKNGFRISFVKQSLTIIVFFIAACINAFKIPYTIIYTALLFLLALFVQADTLKEIKDVKDNPVKWNFE